MVAKRAQIEAVKDLVAQVNLQLASLQGRIAGAVKRIEEKGEPPSS